tara:strand:- start:389 stop:1105 length:717 start_codon:yes stop_codon:yes gene_type:complete
LKITAIIFSRLNSKRLFRKSLIKISNKTLIQHIIDRLKKINEINEIILATSKSKIDKELVKVAIKNNIKIFRGSENNVLKRTYECINKYKINFFLRVCGDRIFFDNKFINSVLKNLKTNSKLTKKYDLISNNSKEKKVDQGLTVEFVSKKCIKKIISKKKINSYNKEHITSYIYENLDKFSFKRIRSPGHHFHKLKYTIDVKKDVLKAKKIIAKLKKNDLYNFNKIYLETKKLNYDIK